MPNFQALKFTERVLNDITRKKNIQIVLNTQTNLLFNQDTPKNLGIENFKPPNTDSLSEFRVYKW